MTNLYLTEQGTYLHKKHQRIVYEKDGETLLERPIKDIAMVIIFGQIQVSVQALLALLENGCDVAMMTQNGHFRGKLVSALGKNSPLRFKQYRLCNDMDYRLETSRKIVGAKIHNCIALLKKYHYSDSNPLRFNEFDNLKAIEEKVLFAQSLDSLRGFEGQASKCYYKGFSGSLTGDNTFPGRKFYPSTDPVNAIMSFGYSFIAREIQGLLEANGIDPYLGIFHEISYGRASLSYDLIEEYRNFLVDRLTLKLFNKKIIDSDDFDIQESNGACYLKRDVLKVFIKHYEETVNEEATEYKRTKRAFRYIFREQVAAFKRALTDNSYYEPFMVEK